jgi:hypothetical protein
VRHLQHLGVEIDSGGQQRLLGIDLGVGAQQQSVPADDSAQYERGVVRIGSSAAERDHRAEHVQVDRPDVEAHPCGHRRCRHAVRSEDAGDHAAARDRLAERARHDLLDVPSTEHAGNPADVVEVVMGEHEQRNPGDAEVVQATVDGDGFRAGIDDDGAVVGSTQRQCVTLSDIARHQQPARDRPLPGDRAHRNLDEQCYEGGCPEQPPGACMPSQQHDGDDDRREQQGSTYAGGPGHGRARELAEEVGDPDEVSAR